MDSCSISQNSRKYWKIFNNLSGKRPHQDPNQPISFNNQVYTKPQSIATHFCNQFTRPMPHRPSPQTRQILKQIHRQHPLDHSSDAFTTAQVEHAIKSSSNTTASSPDGLTILHLRHLGPTASDTSTTPTISPFRVPPSPQFGSLLPSTPSPN